MGRCLFISDLHLDAARPQLTQALASFLAASRDCDSLYVLGDLFEAWVGDDDDSPVAAEVRQLFSEFSQAGPTVHFMRGNRDFLLGESFCADAGGTLLPDPTVVSLGGRRTLLMHGDSLCTADYDYQRFRTMARDPAWQAELLSRSLGERRALAQELREMSRDATSNKAEDIMDVTASEVTRVMQQHGVDCLVHGHTHRPARHQTGSGERWVLGDWGHSGWYLEACSDQIKLIEFTI